MLALQDTTALDFTAHPQTRDLGPIQPPTHQGRFVHSTLAASPDGVPLGLLAQHRWVHDPQALGKRVTRRQGPTACKESQHWLTAPQETLAVLPETVPVLTVADREADIFDLFAAPHRTGADLRIRATYNRRVRGETGRLWAIIRAATVQGTLAVAVGRGTCSPRAQGDAHAAPCGPVRCSAAARAPNRRRQNQCPSRWYRRRRHNRHSTRLQSAGCS